jgi:hypothetical protein
MSAVNENINNNFFSFLSCVMARLAYLKMPEVFQKYTLIMDTIPDKIINSIKQLKNQDDIFNDESIFSNMEEQYFKQIGKDKFIDIIKLELPQKINKIMTTKITNLQTIKNNNVKIIEITDSNENKAFVIADKKLNSIFVLFRGTESMKASASWLNLFRDFPTKPCSNSKNKFLTGIFKLCIENIHTIYYSVCYLANDFLQSKSKNSVKIFTTGHSLGGGLTTIFSYLWLGLKYENIEKIASNISDKIVCVSLASPRVFNEFMVNNDFYNLLNKNKIMYRRIVTKGDSFTTQPFYLKHPINDNSYSYCNQTNFKDKKTIDYNKDLECESVVDSSKSLSLLPHGNYMYVSFYKLLDLKKREVLPSEYKDPVVRIFIGYTNNNTNEYKIVFFYLNDIRYGLTRDSYKPKRDIYILDASKKEDMHMNKSIFNYIIHNIQPYQKYLLDLKDNLKHNVREKDNIYVSHGRPILKIEFEGTNKRQNKPKSFICLTSKNMSKILKNKSRKNHKS